MSTEVNVCHTVYNSRCECMLTVVLSVYIVLDFSVNTQNSNCSFGGTVVCKE